MRRNQKVTKLRGPFKSEEGVVQYLVTFAVCAMDALALT